MQTTAHILMIRPVSFGYNAETAVNNAFQVNAQSDDVQQKALAEFDAFVSLLRGHGIEVTVVEDTATPHTPDSIFPNNWVSFHDDGTVLLYPMFATNRRAERKEHVLDAIGEKFSIGSRVDLTSFEEDDMFLEGTGSMVLDRERRVAYACLSPRTHEKVLEEFCKRAGYRPVLFHATDMNGRDIYHTNVMMCVADRYVVICLDSIKDSSERETVSAIIRGHGQELISITPEQMNHFAGNMLQVENVSGEKFLVMSTQAFESLTPDQRGKLESYNHILHSSLKTIETNGGGSARCMMAEVHLPVKN